MPTRRTCWAARSASCRSPSIRSSASTCFRRARSASCWQTKGWNRVVAFQTRNPLHRAHEYALVYGLETLLRAGHNAGACLNPLIGETKGDDVDADVRMHTYEALIDNRSLGDGDSDRDALGAARRVACPTA